MLNQLGKAVQTFSEAIQLNPELGEAYFRRGICLHLIGEDRMALADFQHAFYLMLIEDPTTGRAYYDPRPRLWEGFLHAKLGDYRAAVQAYSEAIAESDRYTPAFVNRGLAYMMLGDYEKAVADLNDAIRIEPTNGDYYFKRGVAHEQLRELDKARDSFATAIAFNPGFAPAYRHMADVMGQLGHADLADEYRQKADQLAPQPSAQ
jgi:tetratricopeptide (TPR) repeat protein